MMTALARLFPTHVAVLLRCVCVQVIPELNGKLTGMAFRVPTQVRAVSAVRTLGQRIFISSSWMLWAVAWRAGDESWSFIST